MFCPKCGGPLTIKQDHAYCEKGDMYLANAVFKGLDECFITKTRLPRELHFSVRMGGEWFCPRDATRMTEESGLIKCSQCGVAINEFAYALIERHPHLK